MCPALLLDPRPDKDQAMHPSLILTFLALSASASASPLPEPPSLDPLTFTPEQFGAVGDGKANDWEPLKSAFAACASADLKPRQRCRILLEKDYLTAPLVISSSYTTLEITGSLAMLPHEEMCKLVNCGDDPSKGDVPGAFISNYAGDCENVVPDGSEDEYSVCLTDVLVTGSGSVFSTNPWRWWFGARFKGMWRPHMFVFHKMQNLRFENLHLRDPVNHFIEISDSVRSRVSGLTMDAPFLSPNSDGLNFYGGFDSVFENSVVTNGDDCATVVPVNEYMDICSDPEVDPSDVRCGGGHAVLRNLTCNGGHGLSVGGVRHGSVRNVTFENITATGGQRGSTQDEAAGGGCRIKSYPNGTGVVQDIRYKDIIFDDVYLPIQILGHYCPFPCNTPDGDQSVKFKDISFENISGRGKQRHTVVELKCSEYSPCENITMTNIKLSSKKQEVGDLTCENVDSLFVDEGSHPNKCQ